MIFPSILFSRGRNISGHTLCLGALFAVSLAQAWAKSPAINVPEKGVLCDRFICANDRGISRTLTEKHLGNKAAARLAALGEFDLSKFTFANGIFCNVKVRLCREDRYYGPDGLPSGAVSEQYTRLLFGQ